MNWMPHGACWLWNKLLIALHAPGDLGTWFYYMFIPALALYIYRRGRLRFLMTAYPRLWRRGAAFVLLCGLSHLGAFAEIWIGGWIYYATGINKVGMVIASHLFAVELWRRREEIVQMGQVLELEARQSARKG